MCFGTKKVPFGIGKVPLHIKRVPFGITEVPNNMHRVDKGTTSSRPTTSFNDSDRLERLRPPQRKGVTPSRRDASSNSDRLKGKRRHASRRDASSSESRSTER